MTARDDLLAAATRLTERGESPFSPRDLIREARADGSTYKKSTLQTHIVGSMCVQATDHWGGHKFDDFDRVARGQYVLAETAGSGPLGVQQGPTDSSRRPTRKPEQPAVGDHRSEWFWEGNVQAAVVAHLAAEEWRILRVADTHSREHGVDIQARRRGTRLLVEVKGYPSSTYTRGDRAGQPKKHGTASQARAYFSDALLTGLVMRSDHPKARVVLALPLFTTYENLSTRVGHALEDARIEVWLIAEDGSVVRAAPGATGVAATPPPPPAPNLDDSQ